MTRRLLRLEALGGLILAVALALAHIREIRWPVFVAWFVAIDLLGYLPGALAHRRSPRRPIAPVYYTLYNVTHGFLAHGLLAALWSFAAQPEWALLAIPIHLLGDRALFGNFFKPSTLPFEGGPETVQC